MTMQQKISSNISLLPLLMIPAKNKCRTKRGLYEISSNTVYNFQLRMPYNKRFCGSSHGWLAKAEYSKCTITITLLNPFKNLVFIPLPPIVTLDTYINKKYYECNIHKVILSANPTIRPHNYVAIAIYGTRRCLAFIKAGEKVWTYIDEKYVGFTDVIFYKSLVYAVARQSNIVSFDMCYSKNERVIPNVVSLKGNVYAHREYLVKSLDGELWLVNKFIDYPDYDEDYDGYIHSIGTKRFKVYKLELDIQSGRLIRMLKLESLGDNILFLGDNDSVSLSASYFSKYLQKDSIYYTDDFYDDPPVPYPNGPFDMQIYNIKDGSFSQHFPYQERFARSPPALWVFPQF